MSSGFDITETALKNLRRQGIRTFLTLIGIVIGIAAIVSLLSVGQGLSVAVEKQFEQLGSNTIFVIPGAGSTSVRTKLTNTDISIMENVKGVQTVVPIYSGTAVMEFNGQRVNIQVSAAEASKASIFDDTGYFTIDEGRMLTKSDTSGILVGARVAKDFFDEEINLRKQVKINGESYKVVGLLKDQAQSFGGGPSTGTSVFMSLDGFRKFNDSESPSIIFVKTYSPKDVNEATTLIEKNLEKKYGENSVIVLGSEQILEQINSILGLITVFLTGIAAISLIVGGVGITNAMIASVLERTKEIGLMKALGASNFIVLTLFLLEAGFIGAVGGIIGVIVGFGLANIIAFVGQQAGFGLSAVQSPEIIVFALAFSMIVGMISGFYPALRASKLDPVEALRYE